MITIPTPLGKNTNTMVKKCCVKKCEVECGEEVMGIVIIVVVCKVWYLWGRCVNMIRLLCTPEEMGQIVHTMMRKYATL